MFKVGICTIDDLICFKKNCCLLISLKALVMQAQLHVDQKLTGLVHGILGNSDIVTIILRLGRFKFNIIAISDFRVLHNDDSFIQKEINQCNPF